MKRTLFVILLFILSTFSFANELTVTDLKLGEEKSIVIDKMTHDGWQVVGLRSVNELYALDFSREISFIKKNTELFGTPIREVTLCFNESVLDTILVNVFLKKINLKKISNYYNDFLNTNNFINESVIEKYGNELHYYSNNNEEVFSYIINTEDDPVPVISYILTTRIVFDDLKSMIEN